MVVNENGTRQKAVSMFLQQGLGYVQLENSLLLRSTNKLISILKTHCGRKCSAFSMDIKDLYYFLEKNRLMKRGNLAPFQRQRKWGQKAHREKSVPCEERIVYEITLVCRFKNVGQTYSWLTN